MKSILNTVKKLHIFQNKTTSDNEYMSYENAIRLLNENEVWKQILIAE